MKNYLFLLVGWALPLPAICQVAGWQQELNTTIRVTLNDKERTLDAFLETEYVNHSPDTLHYIWFYLWPNAFKDDRTAFSEYLLRKGRTDFYFADKEERGYINRLDFRSGNQTLRQEDHPLYIDMVKVYTDEPLAPGKRMIITTPFFVKLPKDFSGIGYRDGAYHVQHWYPAPAVYDNNGWQLAPYTGQERFPGQPGNFEVQITLPAGYQVRSNGELQDTVQAGSLKTYRYAGKALADFSWSAGHAGVQTKQNLPGKRTGHELNEWMSRILSKRVLPAAGYNKYDGLQLGLVVQNGYTIGMNREYQVPGQYTYGGKPLYDHIAYQEDNDTRGRDGGEAGQAGIDRQDTGDDKRTRQEGNGQVYGYIDPFIDQGEIVQTGRTGQFPATAGGLAYFAAPMFALNSKRITGFGDISYAWRPGNYFRQMSAGLNFYTSSTQESRDSLGKKVFGSFFRVAPYLRITLPSRDTYIEKWLEWKTLLIGERGFEYNRYSGDSLFYPSRGKMNIRYLNQLSFNYASFRVLYPHSVRLEIQQAASFYRVNATGNYFFNYPKGGGLRMRVFAAKFGYMGPVSASEKFGLQRYQPKLTAVRGSEDYTYSNYFAGRNEFEGLWAQQVMNRDGALKLRTDLFQDLQGRSDNWIASVNFNTTLPSKLFPVQLPLRIFLDAGTYADVWKKETSAPRFLYVAGLQLSLFRELLNIYAPVLYSKTFRDNLETVPEENRFFRRLSFSIDVQRLSLKRPGGYE